MAMVQFSLIVSFLLSLCLLSPLTQATDVRYCDKKASYDVKVSGIEISPNPIARGRPTTFNISATAGWRRRRWDENEIKCAHDYFKYIVATGDGDENKSKWRSVDRRLRSLSSKWRWRSANKLATTSHVDSDGEAISGGKLVIDVAYFGFHIYSESDDLCGKTSCPISVGDFIISHSQELPGFTPPGSYTLTMKMEDGNKHQLTCITFDFSIGFLASKAVAAL